MALCWHTSVYSPALVQSPIHNLWKMYVPLGARAAANTTCLFNFRCVWFDQSIFFFLFFASFFSRFSNTMACGRCWSSMVQMFCKYILPLRVIYCPFSLWRYARRLNSICLFCGSRLFTDIWGNKIWELWRLPKVYTMGILLGSGGRAYTLWALNQLDDYWMGKIKRKDVPWDGP